MHVDPVSDVDGMRSAIAPDRRAEGLVRRAADRADVHPADGRVVRASVEAISTRYPVGRSDS